MFKISQYSYGTLTATIKVRIELVVNWIMGHLYRTATLSSENTDFGS